MSFSSDQTKWFAEQVKPHEPLLRGYLKRRFPSLPDHDDLVQEAYRRLFRTEARTHLVSVKGYLFKVVRNVAIDALRRRQVIDYEPMNECTALPVLHEAPSVSDSLDQRQRQDLLVDAIAALPQRCREVVMLRHLEGLSYKEIAEHLGISPNTVKLHIVKGMKECTAFFRRHGLLEETLDRPEDAASAAQP